MDYWDKKRFPRLKRIIFDNTLDQKEAVELVKTGEGRVDLVTELSPLDTLRVAQSPFARVMKNRRALMIVLGLINMRKTGSPWRDVRLRQAVNFALNREDIIRYAAKGNGVIIPALIPRQGLGYDPDLPPYPFDPVKARQLLRDAGYPTGPAVTLIATDVLVIQATVVGRMLEQVGFTVDLQVLDPAAFNQKVFLSHLDQPPERQTWDIALMSFNDGLNFPIFSFYRTLALDGWYDWVIEQPELRQLYEQVLRTVDREKQQELIRQMERHTHEQAYFLFSYNPITLFAVNKAVEFVPYATSDLILTETSVTAQHWSVREAALKVQEAKKSEDPPLRADPKNAGQVALGKSIYTGHCAKCHGVNLEGQPNWRRRLPTGNYPAPPHDETGHTWHHPNRYLFETVKYGWQRFAPRRYKSEMRTFKNVLIDEEIWAVLSYIKSCWPASIREQQKGLLMKATK
jgi:mono/diheme cytochrome c family protein